MVERSFRLRRSSSKWEKTRRTSLKAFAQAQMQQNNMGQAFLDVVRRAVALSRGTPSSDGVRTDVIIYDLKAVIIGTGMTEGRGKGPYFAGNFRGATGFKPEFQDPYNQVQHAMAGIVIGYDFGNIGEWIARAMEEEAQDDRLYMAACPIGNWLSWHNGGSDKLPGKILDAICDGTCK
jgi:hypothetical protein